MADIAWLVLKNLSSAHSRSSTAFDRQGGYGAYTVRDCLSRGGMETEFCSTSTARDYRVVLVPLISTTSVYDFLRAVAVHPDWQPSKRKFKVVVGGFGVHNVFPYRKYADIAVFGRCEDFVVDLAEHVVDGKVFEHQSVMNLPDIYDVKYGQVSTPYKHEVILGNGKAFNEGAIGCSHGCLFCHYRWARQHSGDAAYDMQLISGGTSVETTIWDVFDVWDRKKAKIRFGLDGNSERLRMAFGKPISNAMLIDAIERISKEARCSPTVRPDIYTIGSYPSETWEDRKELGRILSSCKCTGVPVKIMVHLTPFRPSIVTPSQWEPANIDFNWNKFAVTNIASVDKLEAYYRYSLEAPAALLEQMIIERATTDSDDLIRTILFNRKYRGMRSMAKVAALRKTFDLSPYINQYEIGKTLPTSYLHSYTDDKRVEALAHSLRKRLYVSG